MKNPGYVYANKALDSAVRDLKSSFFDIFYHSQGTLLMLMTQLDELEVENQSLKEEAVDLINSQGTLLSESMALVEDLIRSIKKIDNNGKKIDIFNRSYVISRSKQFTKVEGTSVGVAAPVAEVTPATTADAASGAVDENVKTITSPLVGTFYSASSPDAEPFVRVGDTVKKGQVVGIVEAMKLMNEIECEHVGGITEIIVNNGDMVEYGQVLIKVK